MFTVDILVLFLLSLLLCSGENKGTVFLTLVCWHWRTTEKLGSRVKRVVIAPNSDRLRQSVCGGRREAGVNTGHAWIIFLLSLSCLICVQFLSSFSFLFSCVSMCSCAYKCTHTHTWMYSYVCTCAHAFRGSKLIFTVFLIALYLFFETEFLTQTQSLWTWLASLTGLPWDSPVFSLLRLKLLLSNYAHSPEFV